MTKAKTLLLLFQYTLGFSMVFLTIYFIFTTLYIHRPPLLKHQLIRATSGAEFQHSLKASLYRDRLYENNSSNLASDGYFKYGISSSSISDRNITSTGSLNSNGVASTGLLTSNFTSGGYFSSNMTSTGYYFKSKPDARSNISVFFSARAHGLPQTDDFYDVQDPKLGASLINSGTRFLLRGFTGRLGNVLFEFAAAFCIAKLNNLTLVVKNLRDLKYLRDQGIRFEQGLWNELLALPLAHHSSVTCCGFNSKLMVMKSRTSHHFLHGYFQSWKYFEPCKTELKRVLTFKDSIALKASTIVENLRTKHPGKVLIGVHVRMEDYLKGRAVRNGKTVAPPGYYRKAMTYFRSRFQNVIFVVVTSKLNWFRKEVSDSADVYLLGWSDSPTVDMEVLSRLDHLIFSVGTFGWWAGYRNKGAVVCYRDFFTPRSKYGRQLWNGGADFLYPGWVAL